MKRNNFLKTVLLGTMISFSFMDGQCATPANIFAFTANGKNYELVRQRTSWFAAAQCAVQRGGYLAEINSGVEEGAIFQRLQSPQAGINLSQTTAADGGGASYVWLGGVRSPANNQWIWDGNADGAGTAFWQGGLPANGGQPLNSAYTNWGGTPTAPAGAEPDNFQGMQEVLAMGLTSWPNGSTGQWNDISGINQLFYIIEMNATLGTDDLKSEKGSVQLYPNAVKDFLSIKTTKNMTGIAFTDASGRKVKSVSVNATINEKVDCTSLADGIYFIKIIYQDKTSSNHKILKTH
ncbi:T9SS type A sorting domain-containing protein [Chryseobacterium herbae]|uniref:T9SS type A sorting domain-containing protein n=1 Tax=Chryseobacterium herbae TaxID=2976476 RepID=A0ABT2J2F7_9FLAO|nr:T9SS type A sorting domain-containing protein [Chryseobacterium sp. pc1-10]MCT2564730.1 T9SS type A sorting domain-containing protein [Chryseobacterium sp. pc1-10]